MSNLSSNLPLLRRRAGYTQESLAEVLGVSRQAVTKWEGGTTLPEAATLLTLAELLDCTLDQLMREELAEDAFVPAGARSRDDEDARFALFVAYDKHMDRFAFMMAGGVALILLGMAALMALYALGINNALLALPLLLGVAAAVFLFIFGGTAHSDFRKAHPVLPEFYSPEALTEFRRFFRLGMSISVSAAVADVAVLVAAVLLFESGEQNGMGGVAVFFTILALSVGAMVLLGVQHSKFDIKTYNQTAACLDHTAEE